MSEQQGRARRWFKVAALNVVLFGVSLLFACGAAEIAVRIAAPQQLIQLHPDLWRPVDTLGWERRPNADVSVNTGERTVRVMSDGEAFRIGKAGRQSGDLEVLVLGDSFIEALQVEYEQSLTGLLQSRLPQLVNRSVAVRNAGINGWNPNHYLLKTRQVLSREKLDLVITVLYVGNDPVTQKIDYFPPRQYAKRYHFRMPKQVSKAEFVDAFLRPINDGLEVRSHLFVMIKNSLETLRMRAGVHAMYLPEEVLRAQANSPRWSVTASICREIADLVRAQGGESLFVLIPADFQVNTAKFHQYLAGFGVDSALVDVDQPNRRLREELEKLELKVVDALPQFRAARAAGKRLYGTVDPHFSPTGHQQLSDLIIPLAAKQLTSATKAAGPEPDAPTE